MSKKCLPDQIEQASIIREEKPAPAWVQTRDFDQQIIDAFEILEICCQSDQGRLAVCRDSMSALDGSDSLPEDDKGVYWQALQLVRGEFPQLYLTWGGKDDDYLWLTIYENPNHEKP